METLEKILERVAAKNAGYTTYNFEKTEYVAFTTFFDLAQEFDSIEDFHCLCVAIPKGFFNLDARLYLIDPKLNSLSLVSSTEAPGHGLNPSPPPPLKADERHAYSRDNSLILAIRGKTFLIDQLPFRTDDNVLGILEVYPAKDMNPHHELFFEKYANRIGFNIHNRFLVEKNIEHLRFIRSLVGDIEHNVIAPNMIYRLYLKHMRSKIMKNIELERLFSRYVEDNADGAISKEHLLGELHEVNGGLLAELENIEKHYQNMSLFLETLFRRSHFDKGRLTLLTKPCNMKKDVVQPQLERFAEQFKQLGIEIADQFSGIPDEEVISVVDVGLMAQVYANLFSNALKYAEAVITQEGERKKYVAYGREIIKDFFGPGKDGIKYNVFTTGKHIPADERERIFEDEYRGAASSNKPGTGHGLAFIKNAVEIHGGVVGYEATQYGNNFYFVLPK
ncbi:MAG: ATP-binding protein [Thermodesulfovibrionales bacterium]|jgi:signal transduction histidine kinase